MKNRLADELKRVGLIFDQKGGTDFKRTLQEINIEMNKNYNQFKLTQAQWDKSTTSTQKMRAEQEYLRNAYEIQEDRVKTLRMQLLELENSENKNTTAIKKKRNELTAAEIKLETYNKKIKDIENQLKNTGKQIEEFGVKVEKNGKKIEEAGKKMSAFSVATGAALLASAKSAIDFEDAFTGVEKTVDGTAKQMEELKQGIRNMAKEIPASTTEISAVAEAAGQLGIQTEDILSFTRVMIDLGNATNLSAEEAASSLAKFANVTKMNAKDYDRLGSTIVALGNNFATTEADIVAMATRLAATGELAGLSQSQILSLATAMSSVGIEAEAGGSAMSKLLKKIQVATETGSKDLTKFAKVAGMSASDFKKAYQKDAVEALTAFISGLNDTKRNGKSAVAVLEDMGLTEVRLSNTILSLANASDVMTKAVKLGNDAWEDNTALSNEANKRYGTLKSKIQIAINKFKDLAITFGNKLLPTIDKGIKYMDKIAKKVENLSDEDVKLILNIAKTTAAIAPLLTIAGKVTSAGGTAIKTIGTFTQAIGVMRGKTESGSDSVNNLAKFLTKLTSPAGLATAAILATVGAVIYLKNAQTDEQRYAESLNKQMQEAKQSIDDYNASVDETTNSELTHMARIRSLKNELNLIVDENGKVKDGYKERASFILNELNSALGTEYQMNNDIIQSYKDISSEIDTLIQKKEADIVLAGEASKWEKAYNDQQSALVDQNTAYHALEDTAKKYGVTVEDLCKETKKWHEEYDKWMSGSGLEQLYRSMTNKLPDILNKYTDKDIQRIENLINAHNQATDRIKNNVDSMESYYDKMDAYVKEDYESVVNTVKTTTDNWTDYSLQKLKDTINAEGQELKDYTHSYNTARAELAEQQRKAAADNLKNIAEELVKRTNTIHDLSKDEVEAWKALSDKSYDAYQTGLSRMEPEMRQKIVDITGVIYQETPDVSNATEFMANEILDRLDKDEEFKQEALSDMYSFLNGLSNSELRDLLETAGIQNADKVMQGIRNGNLAEEEGVNILSRLNAGLSSNAFQGSLFRTASSIAQGIASRLSVKFNIGGVENAFKSITGFINGSHKLGLDYVPKDDYIAKLHKGERVLTAQENKEYMEAEKLAKKQGQSESLGMTQAIDYGKLADACNSKNARIEALLVKLIDVTGKMKLVLDTGAFVGETKYMYNEALAEIQELEGRGG